MEYLTTTGKHTRCVNNPYSQQYLGRVNKVTLTQHLSPSVM